MDSRRMANPAARLRGTSAVAPPFLSHSNESHMRTELIEANLRGWLEGSDVWRAVPSSRPVQADCVVRLQRSGKPEPRDGGHGHSVTHVP